MLKLLIGLTLLYIIFIQGRYVSLEVYKFFRAWYKKRHPSITITRRPPQHRKQNRKKGEYIDYEEVT